MNLLRMFTSFDIRGEGLATIITKIGRFPSMSCDVIPELFPEHKFLPTEFTLIRLGIFAHVDFLVRSHILDALETLPTFLAGVCGVVMMTFAMSPQTPGAYMF